MLFISALLLVTISAAQHKGYMNFTTIGILAGTSADENPAPVSAVMDHHYRFSNLLAPGITLGIEQLNENTMPLALNCKMFLPANRCEFFAAFMGGYSVPLEKPDYEGIEKAHGGALAGAEIGLTIAVNSGASIVVGFGYRYSALNYSLNDWWVGAYERKITYNRFSVRMGVAIH